MDATGGGHYGNFGTGTASEEQSARGSGPGASHGGRGGRSGSSLTVSVDNLLGSGPSYGNYLSPVNPGSGSNLIGGNEVFIFHFFRILMKPGM